MKQHGIKAVTVLTGLSDHVLRVWEKRYTAVTPERSATNRRLYSDADVTRLQNLAKLIENGYSIGQIASLGDAELHELLTSVVSVAEVGRIYSDSDHIQDLIKRAIQSVHDFNQDELEKTLDRANNALGYVGLLEFVIMPLMQQIGTAWSSGELTSAGEHAATSFIKEYLSRSVRSFAVEENAPTLLATTPAGQLHELGAFIGACIARKNGWHVVYLGPSLPADEIAGTAKQCKASAVMLSIVYPLDDPRLGAELERLNKQLPDDVRILVGGTQLSNYQKSLDAIGATVIGKIGDLQDELAGIRSSRLAPIAKAGVM